MQYERDHQHHTLYDFWQFVHFSDETHFDPDAVFNKRVLKKKDAIHIQRFNVLTFQCIANLHTKQTRDMNSKICNRCLK